MKVIRKIGLLVILLVLSSGQVFGQKINFFNGTLDEAIKKAKSEKKFIFFLIKKQPTEIHKNIVEVIDRHAYDMAIYNEVEVSEFYNNNFINFLYEDAGYLTDSYGNLLSYYPDKATKNIAKQLISSGVSNDFSSMFISYLGDIAQINDSKMGLYESKTKNMILGYAKKVLKDYELNIVENNEISVLEKINSLKQLQDYEYNAATNKYIKLSHDTIFQSKSLKDWYSRIGCWKEYCITSAIPTSGDIDYFVEFIFNLKAFKDEQVDIIRNATFLNDGAYGDNFVNFRDNRIGFKNGTQYTCIFESVNNELPLGYPVTIHGDTLKMFYSSIDNLLIVNGTVINIGKKVKPFLTSIGIMAGSDEVNEVREKGLISLIIGKYITKYSEENMLKLKGNWYEDKHFEKMKYLVSQYPNQIEEFEKIPYEYLKKFYVEPKSNYFPERFQKFYEIFPNSKKIAEIKELESKVKYFDGIKKNKSAEIKEKKEKLRMESGDNAVFSIDHSAGGWDYINFADGNTGEVYYYDGYYGIKVSSWLGLGTEFIPYLSNDYAIQASYEYIKFKNISNYGRYYPPQTSYSSGSNSNSYGQCNYSIETLDEKSKYGTTKYRIKNLKENKSITVYYWDKSINNGKDAPETLDDRAGYYDFAIDDVFKGSTLCSVIKDFCGCCNGLDNSIGCEELKDFFGNKMCRNENGKWNCCEK